MELPSAPEQSFTSKNKVEKTNNQKKQGFGAGTCSKCQGLSGSGNTLTDHAAQ